MEKFLSLLRSYSSFGRMAKNWFDASDSQIMNENTSSVVGKRVSSSTSNTSPVTVSNGLTSASHEEVPVTVGNNGMDDCGSTPVAPRAMGLTMAETLVRGSPRSHAPAQVSFIA